MKYLKPILSSLMLLTFCLTSHAQKLDLKGGMVYINDTAVIKYKMNGWTNEYSFTSIKNQDEIIHVKVDRSQYGGHISISFPQNYVSFDTRKILMATSPKPLLKKLIKEGVLNDKGEIDYEKVRVFKTNYESED